MNTARPNDTIAAISTPPGHGAIGIVRFTGPRALPITCRVFRPRKGGAPFDLQPRTALSGHIHHPDNPSERIDQCVLVFFKGPRSYTGEDTVEIHLHGGPLIMANALDAVIEAGARLAEPGEFTKRAFFNGKIDLSQAEAVASLIFADTEEARRVMLQQVEGAMGQEAREFRKVLLDLKVALESAIDFPEDVEDPDLESHLAALTKVNEMAQALLETSREGIALREGMKAVIVGAPNAGKSSLLNTMIKEDRAIVHEVPGTTRDFIEGRISIMGIPLAVIDTAGIREAQGTVESEGIEKTRNLMGKADLLLVVLDGSRPLAPGEIALLEETKGANRVVVVNKCDLPPSEFFEPPPGSVWISALTGTGVEDLKRLIHRTFTGGGTSLGKTGAVVTTIRQRDALQKVLGGTARVLEGIRRGRGPELLAVDVDEALMGVGDLNGEVTAEDVLEEIFSKFCIGK